jgi:hypothetical protein
MATFTEWVRVCMEDGWGGGEFIALCTALNIAAVSWDKFQESVKSLTRRAEEIINTAKANIGDSQDQDYLARGMDRFCQKKGRVWGSFLWPLYYFSTWMAVVAGSAMLFFGKSCPFVFLLLAPVGICLLCQWFWLQRVKWKTRDVGEMVTWQAAEKQVAEFTDTDVTHIELPAAESTFSKIQSSTAKPKGKTNGSRQRRS